MIKSQPNEWPAPPKNTAASATATGVVAVAAGSCLQVWGPTGELRLEKTLAGAELRCHYGHHSPLRLRPDGVLLAWVLDAKQITVMTLQGEDVFCAAQWEIPSVMDISWSPDGKHLASCSIYGVSIHDDSGTEVHRLLTDDYPSPIALSFDLSGLLLGVGCADMRTRVCSLPTFQLKHTTPEEQGQVYSLCFDRTSERIAYWNVHASTVVVRSLVDGCELLRIPDTNAQVGDLFCCSCCCCHCC